MSNTDQKVDDTNIKKMVKKQQKMFEMVVKILRRDTKALDLIKTSSHFNFGKDAQKNNSNLGIRKWLQRLCSKHINTKLVDWIPNNQVYSFCVLSGGNNCCYNYKNDYEWNHQLSFNLSEKLSFLCTNQIDSAKIVEKALIKLVINNKNKNCVLNINGIEFYIKSIKKDRLQKSMEISQNAGRVSCGGGGKILSKIDDNILLMIQSELACIGYYDLVTHKVYQNLNKNCNSKCLHRIIYLHDDYLLDTYMSFGIKKYNNNNNSGSNGVIATIFSNELENKCGILLDINNNTQQQQQNPFPVPNANNNNNNNYVLNRGGPHIGSAQNSRYNPLGTNNNNNNPNNINLPTINHQ